MLTKYFIHLQKGRPKRNARGQGIVVMMFFLAAFIIGPVCFFGYEVSLYNLAKLQLKAVLDASALAAGTQQTSDSSTNFSTVQTDAMLVAKWMFAQNSILGDSASGVINEGVLSNPATMSGVAAHQTEIGFQFINPTNAGVVSLGDVNGKEIRVYGSYGFVPQFIGFAKLTGTFPVQDFSNGGLPMLDAVLCFDLSASMDDFTYVWLVHRYYSASTTYAEYATVNFTGNGNGMNPNGDTSQALYYALNCNNDTGTGTNVTWPLNVTNQESYAGSPLFDFNDGSGGGSNLRTGSPANKPANGNYPTNGAANNVYTDIVVDVGYTQSAPMVGQKSAGDLYAWPTINTANLVGMLVESSRGNLETQAAATTAGVNPNYCNPGKTWASYFSSSGSTLWPAGVVSSWYNRYWSVANNWNYINPIGAGALAAETFFSTMNNDCDSHFGLVCYSTSTNDGGGEGYVGCSSATSAGYSNATNWNTVGGNSGYANSSTSFPWDGGKGLAQTPMPYVALDPNNTNFQSCSVVFGNALYQSKVATSSSSFDGQTTYNGSGLVIPTSSNQQTFLNQQVKANGGTDIAGSLHSALQMLLTTTEGGQATPTITGCQGLARQGSTRAVVLFTDGRPTESSIGSDGTAVTDAQNMGSAARSAANIPIYCVGLCMTPTLQSAQNAVLGTVASNSGQGAQFFQATTSAQLEIAFEAVARALVQLVRS